ncbi:MAG: hypothetical protein IH973_15330, partial [Myxococcales bacterium]|nr:hypothetical protein [Myxococcales bacterium]
MSLSPFVHFLQCRRRLAVSSWIGWVLVVGLGASVAHAQLTEEDTWPDLTASEAGDPDIEAAEPGTDAPKSESFEGATYTVTSFELDFMVEPPNAPSISILRKTRITLGREPLKAWALDSVYVSPERSKDQVEFSLDEIPADGPVLFAAGALASINRQIVEAMAKQGLGSIIVAPDEMDIGFTTGEDLREEGNTTLHLTIFLPTIKELQSFATGERVPENDATNNPVHSRILENSPVQAGETFWPNRVDDYVARLNRHPGRRVVAQLSPSYDREQLYLDYQITESKPWIAYAAISNSGAESTGIWQARIGMVHLQLTNRDDILSLDFVMNTNTDVRAVNLGYQLPLWIDTVRLEVDAGYADFEASSADAFPFISDFKGTQAHGGFNIAYN